MQQGKVLVVNRLGLHARAAAKLVKTAESFESRIIISSEDGSASANAKSILSLLTLAASKGGTLRISAEGADEIEAFETITSLFESGFGEK
ncbi:MAG: HPr family phosphocarrier protein [Pyrinomonadaceae bacterium]|nr:HPr family phosphocarrier protein [Pyrinomonadaceae bacterium]